MSADTNQRAVRPPSDRHRTLLQHTAQLSVIDTPLESEYDVCKMTSDHRENIVRFLSSPKKNVIEFILMLDVGKK